ncbi:phage shock protein PspA [Croceicoccus gelatinilyticus]|uniref:phage shock protein PspA n=1 Tax=Croceicoccus gelatinilyticus TaxID=2835536 RepID=UPI001BCE995E|nr:phage shock protein PspA [Croceicoccus gelatinilyticus]MBS7670290.1 phage shock protein PspA [Croceicoccus gelatinilyticus]
MSEPFDLEPEREERRRRAARVTNREERASSRIDSEVARLRNGNKAEGQDAVRPESRRNMDISQYGAPLMGIFSRTRDIIAANFADLIEKADDPHKMIRMIIVEMEETLVEVRASAARTIADQKEMQRHQLRLEKLQSDWGEKAELALSKQREDLARAALVEKRKAGDLSTQLKAEIELLDESLRSYEEDISKLQGRLREARSRQSQIAARLESAENRYKLRTLLSTERVDEAMARFDQLERRVDYAEGRAEAISLSAAKGEMSLAEQIDALNIDDTVDAELEDMKRALKGDAKED